ncbi:MAG: hypothetical protein AAF593_00605 [Planctomycetota bacterium]
MSKKPRKDAVEDVLGDESPILGRLAKTASTPAAREKPPAGAKPAEKPAPEPAQAPQAAASKPPASRPLGIGGVGVKEPKDKAKRVKVSAEEERTIDDLISTIGRATGTRMQYAQVTRAMWALLLDAEKAMGQVTAPQLKRPANADGEAMAEYEAEIADYLLDVFKTMKKAR